MKKFSRFAAVLVLSASLCAPLLVYAVGYGGACPSGNECNSGFVCQPPPNSTCACPPGATYNGTTCVSGGGATLNRTYLDFYYYLVVNVINSIFVPILIAIAFFMVLYGAFKYFILKSAEEGERQTGRTVMLYGVIGLVVIFSVWALVNIVRDTIIPGSATQTVPAYPKL